MGRRGINPDGSVHINRPSNAWILFRAHWQSVHRKSLQGMKFGEISKAVGKVWQSMAPEERAVWEKLEEKAKVEHARLYPDYKFKPKRSNKKSVKEKKRETKQDKIQEPPKKRRRMGEFLTNSVLETPAVMGGDVAATSSLVMQEECFSLPDLSLENVPTEVPASLEEDVYAHSSFTAYNQPFTFHMPPVPSAPNLHPAHEAHATADSDPNAFRFGGDYEWPAANICFAPQANTAAQNYLNAFQFDSGYELHSTHFQFDHQANATGINDANAYHPSAEYDWPSRGGFGADLSQFSEYSNAGTDNYANNCVQGGIFDYDAYYARFVASTYHQDAYGGTTDK